ncbi:PREDICTED: 30S ribosomal protein 3, chloroplastic-like isoform X2 [Ipomoea nil]|uniref:30S ribosomal protein 3, chloroplastic-like isoform X2 n=1 Tax=Ipomoea nil TaxID=35883 RepID=UPI0009019B03|nr:PREDICTED: 30S ribosomal protein 3, chloroplastic-like isoform X2 [Ipomoea nil]
MMLSAAARPAVNCILESPASSFSSHKPFLPNKLFFPQPPTAASQPSLLSRKLYVSASSSAAGSFSSTPLHKEKLGVVVKPMEKPRLVLKFIWLEKNIGISLDQVIPGHGTIPISPYYFWPRKDAWEELKVMLESKPWISQKQMVILLNQATDIINLWQQSGGNFA